MIKIKVSLHFTAFFLFFKHNIVLDIAELLLLEEEKIPLYLE